MRGLKTLALRMERHCSNALSLAAWLEQHPKVRLVRYPGLRSHPQHELARRQMHGFGGMITIHLDSDLSGTRRFLEHTKLFALAESLGGVESLIEHPALMIGHSLQILAQFNADALGRQSLPRIEEPRSWRYFRIWTKGRKPPIPLGGPWPLTQYWLSQIRSRPPW